MIRLEPSTSAKTGDSTFKAISRDKTLAVFTVLDNGTIQIDGDPIESIDEAESGGRWLMTFRMNGGHL